MTFKPARLLLALIAVAAAPAFAQNAAVVNGKAIPTAKVEAVVKQVVAQGQQQDSPQLREMIKKSLIGREVMIQEAEKQGFAKNNDVKTALEQARQDILLQALAADFVKKNPVSDAEIKAEYDRAVAAEGGKEYHVRHILVDSEKEATDIIAKLKAGAKFEDLAKNSKDTGSAANGGDLDWGMPSNFPKVFADAFTALQKGQVTEKPVQTPSGFHVIKVDDVRDAKLPSLDEAKQQVAEKLMRAKLQNYQEALVKKAKVN
ncbi:peptidylprolyl isomerase [Pseudoduganella violaceinigra]|uniref:peptidylprolyl isomerase n=1 Tax=Pseudoduganella violaceinigra TaxID=246602 RepID=UPI000428E981|nr:peptidyl-prolyl cis-trans isomerase [Pseudoduganella violaceinigra]